MNKDSRAVIAEYIRQHPELTYVELAKMFNCCKESIYNIAAKYEIHRRRGAPSSINIPASLDIETH